MNKKIKSIFVVLSMSAFSLYLSNVLAAPEEKKAEAAAPAKAEAQTAVAPADVAAKPAVAASAAATQAEKDPLATAETVLNQTQTPPETAGVNLSSSDNALFIDLAREIEVSERERKRMETLKGTNYKVSVVEEELKNRLAELNRLKEQLNATVPGVAGDIKKKEKENEKLVLLVSLYESLSAEQAADLMKRLPIPVTLTMFEMMNTKKSSKILAAMDPKMAAELSQRILRTSSATLASAETGGAK